MSALTDAKIRNAKPAAKAFRLFDGRGLYLEVSPNGGRWWRWKYREGGKEKRLSLGTWPDVTLKAARDRCEDVRRQLAAGTDPASARKADKIAKREAAATTFEAIAREWHERHSEGLADTYTGRVLSCLERDLFPWIGARPIGEIDAKELLECLRRIEERGAVDTAHRARGYASQVFRYAVSTRRADRDPSPDLRGALRTAIPEHFAAVTDPDRLAELLRTMGAYSGRFVVRCALQLAPLLFVRPGELRKAKWEQFNLEAGEWRFTTSKTGTALVVPLARQAVAILRELEPLTGSGVYVFPNGRSALRPMSENAVLGALRRLEIPKEQATGHGFRATARTMLEEVLGYPAHLIEQQLGHTVRDPLGRAYNRTQHLAERRRMMQAWADYLEGLEKEGSKVVPLHRMAS